MDSRRNQVFEPGGTNGVRHTVIGAGLFYSPISTRFTMSHEPLYTLKSVSTWVPGTVKWGSLKGAMQSDSKTVRVHVASVAPDPRRV